MKRSIYTVAVAVFAMGFFDTFFIISQFGNYHDPTEELKPVMGLGVSIVPPGKVGRRPEPVSFVFCHCTNQC